MLWSSANKIFGCMIFLVSLLVLPAMLISAFYLSLLIFFIPTLFYLTDENKTVPLTCLNSGRTDCLYKPMQVNKTACWGSLAIQFSIPSFVLISRFKNDLPIPVKYFHS
jgi:hypothetical protein